MAEHPLVVAEIVTVAVTLRREDEMAKNDLS